MSTPRPTVADKRRAFHALHRSGCFAIPNPWDVGSARYLQHLGFKAIASTSAGFAFAQGRPDGAIPCDMMLAHLHELAHASDLPLNADFEAGYADDLAGVAESVRLAVETGISGVSIEDGANRKLYSIDDAVARLRAARAAVDKAGGDVLLVGRAECFLLGRPDLDETIARLKAYSNAGADCLYAPGITTREQISAVIKAVAPKPVNVLIGPRDGLMPLEVLAAAGVRRVSVGGAIARAAYAKALELGAALLSGDLPRFATLPAHGTVNGLMRGRDG